MKMITQEEAMAIRKEYPNTHIHRTVHKYYVEETPAATRFLARRSGQEVEPIARKKTRRA